MSGKYALVKMGQNNGHFTRTPTQIHNILLTILRLKMLKTKVAVKEIIKRNKTE